MNGDLMVSCIAGFCGAVLLYRLVYLQYLEFRKTAKSVGRKIQGGATVLCLLLLTSWVFWRLVGGSIKNLCVIKYKQSYNNVVEVVSSDAFIRVLLCINIAVTLGYWGSQWFINGVRTRMSSKPTVSLPPPLQQVFVNPTQGCTLNIDSLTVVMTKILELVAETLSKSKETEKIERESNLEHVGKNICMMMADQKRLIELVELRHVPQMNAIASSFVELVDVMHEEAASTRNLVRDSALRSSERVSRGDTSTEEVNSTEFVDRDGDNHISPVVAVARAKSGSKRPIRTAGSKSPPQLEESSTSNSSPVLTDRDVLAFSGKTRQELLLELQQYEKERRLQNRRPDFLLDEEKETASKSLATLDRQWRETAGWKLKPTDYQDIGILDKQQLELPRHLIVKLIRQRRTNSFVKNMTAQGKELKTCEKCSKIYLASSPHNCFVIAGWSSNAKKDGIPATKDTVVTQLGKGGLQIRRVVGVNPEAVNSNYQQLARYKLVMEDQNSNSIISPAANSGQKNDTTEVLLETTVGDTSESKNEGVEETMVDVIIDESPGIVNSAEAIILTDPKTNQFFRIVPC